MKIVIQIVKNDGNCVSSCERDYYYDNIKNQNICKCILPQCKTCSIDSLNLNLCTSCEDNYYPIYNEESDTYKNCSKDLEGYYLDNINLVYKLCYSTCKT